MTDDTRCTNNSQDETSKDSQYWSTKNKIHGITCATNATRSICWLFCKQDKTEAINFSVQTRPRPGHSLDPFLILFLPFTPYPTNTKHTIIISTLMSFSAICTVVPTNTIHNITPWGTTSHSYGFLFLSSSHASRSTLPLLLWPPSQQTNLSLGMKLLSPNMETSNWVSSTQVTTPINST